MKRLVHIAIFFVLGIVIAIFFVLGIVYLSYVLANEEELLFSTNSEFSDSLDRKEFPADLRRAFEENKIPLYDNTIVSVEQENSEWLINDEGNKQTYLIKRIGDGLNIYEEGNNSLMAAFENRLAVYEAAKHYNRGLTHSRQGKLDEAVVEYKKAIDINPNDTAAHYNLGHAYRKQGKLDEAIAEYQKTISINPYLKNAHNNLVNAYRKQGKLDEAIAEYKRVIGIFPNDSVAHYNLACAYSLKNEKALAIESLRKAIIRGESWIEHSKTDSDFDNIRQSPEFQDLINSVE